MFLWAKTKKHDLTLTRINLCSVSVAFALKVPLGNANLGWGSAFWLGGDLVETNSAPDSHFQASSFARMFVQVCLYFYCKCLWRCLKFVVRKLTGQCELQRICYNTKPGAARTMKIGNCKITEFCMSLSLSACVWKYCDFILINKLLNECSINSACLTWCFQILFSCRGITERFKK